MHVPPEHILLIRLKSIGDVILTAPAVHAIRQNFPAAKITFLTSKENAGLLRSFQEVDEIIALDRAALRSGNPLRMFNEFFGLLKRLRGGKFSLVVDFQGYGETAWLTRITGALQRWCNVYRPGGEWAYTRFSRRDNSAQIADSNLSLLQQCGLEIGPPKNELIVPADSLAAAQAFFIAQKLDPEKPTLFIQAFTSSPHKNWPLDQFLALAAHFRAQGVQIIFACGPNEVGALQPAQAAGHAIAAGVPLLTAAGLMKLSTVVVGGATGLVHLAVTLQKRVVMLIGYPDLEPGFPYQHKDWAVLPEDGRGTEKISLPRVIVACQQALDESVITAADSIAK